MFQYLFPIFSTVPPHRLTVLSADGMEVGPTIGPIVEGDSLRITCESEGGNPSPTVSWWEGNIPFGDTQSTQRPQQHIPSNSPYPNKIFRNFGDILSTNEPYLQNYEGTVATEFSSLSFEEGYVDEDPVFISSTVMASVHRVANTLLVDPLDRRFFNKVLTCKASNTNLSAPIETSVTIDMMREY